MGDHPFKRRRRRLVVSWLLFVALMTVNAFVPPRLTPSTLNIDWREHVVGTLSLKGSYQRQHISFLQSIAGASEDASKAATDKPDFRIPPEQLERLKESVDLVSMIESYGLRGFQRMGDHRAKVICPFHDDHNPSLHIDSQRRLYKCFSCGAGGDCFRFVQQYSELEGKPLTFYQAVRHVAQEFGDPSLKLDLFSPSTGSRMSDEERKALNEKKQRLLLANAAAAAFYGKCLVQLPAAGVARSHVQSRGLSPTTVQAFAMGYAPDAYFRVKGEWGKGSLVEHLHSLGFKPSEIVQAGLATRTKGFRRLEHNTTNDGRNATVTQGEERDDDYSTLIDRFRNRVVVPIFDSKGANVLAFGGRILPPEETDTDSYQSPKYINSPESPVFRKKNVLFGQHAASNAVVEMRKNDESGPVQGSVVIVEGYMDAIALWEVGVREVVASMGTGLTMEQLANAARTAGVRGGRIVLCFDGDDAGEKAIERLCTGSLLAKTAEEYVVEILIATLPSGVKDPAEYIESKGKKAKTAVGNQFRKEVLDTARDWTAWYLDRLLRSYDDEASPGSSASFADICDRVSDFLSRFPNPAERTKRAHDVAGSLADVISGGSGDVSNALRIQLETDLVNMVARKASARESIERRIESVGGVSPEGTNQKLARMSKGDGMSLPDESSKLSTRALRDNTSIVKSNTTPNGKRKPRAKIVNGSTISHQRERRRLRRASSRRSSPPSLTPHFSGFEFENQSDAEWLNLPREKWKRKKHDLTLGTSLDGERMAKALAYRTGEDYVSGFSVDDLVYFNSNQYHGSHFLTRDAVDAGYRSSEVTPDVSIVTYGIGTLVGQDSHTLVESAEDMLLRSLVKFDSARMAMVHSLATSDATGSRNSIEWSTPERSWLFDQLVEQRKTIPEDLLVDGRMQDLRDYLSSLPDLPVGAFSHVQSPEPVGSDVTIQSTSLQAKAVGSANGVRIENQGSRSDSVANYSTENDVSTPSDYSDIENWASSYDPSLFDGADSDNDQRDVPTRVSAEIVPQGLNASAVNDEMAPGTLDAYFVRDEDLFAETYDASVSRELRAELEAQEAHATLLRASALKQLAAAKEEWLTVGRVLIARLDEEDSVNKADLSRSMDKPKSQQNGVIELDTMPLQELKECFHAVATRVRDISEKAHHLDQSAKRIGSRLMDYSNADGIEGRVSMAQQDELASMVDDHVNHLPENWKAPDSAEVNNAERVHNNQDPAFGWGDEYGLEQNESFEEDMAQIIKDWGEWADDDFRWSPEGNLNSAMLSQSPNSDLRVGPEVKTRFDDFELGGEMLEDEESLEDALHRLETEWNDWESNGMPTVNGRALDSDDSPSDKDAADRAESGPTAK